MTINPSCATKLLLLAAVCSCGAAVAQDPSWIVEPQLTPARLAADGAALTANESLRWPEGPSVEVTYWLGAGDIVFPKVHPRKAGSVHRSQHLAGVPLSDLIHGQRLPNLIPIAVLSVER